MTLCGIPDEEESRRTAIDDYLRRWWTVRVSQPGDRVVEVTRTLSTHLPFFVRHRPDLHSLTILSRTRPRVVERDIAAPFPVTLRHGDVSQRWPVAGPFDLVIHTDPAADSPERWWAGVGRAVAVLTLGGRIVLDVPGGIAPRPADLRAAGLVIDEIRGVASPADPGDVGAIVSTRFGPEAAGHYHAVRRGCPGEFVDPIVATTLVNDAREVLHVCRKLPPSAPERR